MEDPDRPGDHACPHTLVTSIPDGIHKHKHTHNVNRWIEAKLVGSRRGGRSTKWTASGGQRPHLVGRQMTVEPI